MSSMRKEYRRQRVFWKILTQDGAPLEEGGIKYYDKGKLFQNYETPYGVGGVVRVERHLYQSSKDGKTVCPLETNARMDGTCILIKGEGWRESETGTISLYDGVRERAAHNLYRSAA